MMYKGQRVPVKMTTVRGKRVPKIVTIRGKKTMVPDVRYVRGKMVPNIKTKK